MPESLLTILKLLLMALVYLFFFRVLRAVWAEVHLSNRPAAAAPPQATPAPARAGGRERSAAPTTKGTARLKVLEPPEQRGQSFDLAEELTVGRAAGCQVRIQDTFASQLHARIYRREGQLYIEDLGSTNGTYLNRKGTKNREKIAGALPLRSGDKVVIGKTVMEVGK